MNLNHENSSSIVENRSILVQIISVFQKWPLLRAMGLINYFF